MGMRLRLFKMLALANVAALPMQAWAASESADAAASPIGSGGAVLEDIVVTAQKRAQSIERVPASIQVISGGDIAAYQTSSLKAVAARMPNVVLTASPSGAVQANIRGFGTSTANSGFEQSVGLYVDGVYSPRPHSYTGAVFDIDRVEVVKGTQGTLFGKNASVGAMSLVTRKPGRAFGGYLDGSYEFRLDETRLEGAMDVPIGERFRTRIAGVYGDQSKGWVRNLANGKQEPTSTEYAGRIRAEWDATDTLTFNAKGEFSRYKRIGDPFVGVGGTVFNGIEVEDAIKNVSSNLIPGDGGQASNRRRSNVATAGFDWKLGNHTVTAITSWQKLRYDAFVDLDESAGPVDYVVNFYERFRQFTQELRIASDDSGAFSYVAGLFYLNQMLKFGTDTIFIPAPSQQLLTVDARAYSAFAQGTFKATDRLTFTAGLRYTRDEKEGRLDIAKGNQSAVTRTKANDDSFDWSFVGEYEVIDGTRLYGSVSRGHKGQGFANSVPGTALVPARPVFDGEKATNYEIGIKSRFLGGRARGNLAIYQLDVNGFQASQFDPATRLFIVQNVDARSRGVEAELQLLAAEDLQINFSGAYNDANIRATGKQLVSAPRWNMTAGFDYTPQLTDNIELQAGAQFNYVTKYPHQFDLLPGNFTPGHSNLDARIGVKLSPSDIVIAVIAKNLTNERYADFAYGYAFDAPGTAFTQQLNRPRTIALSVHLPF
ncbi:hypothetical protein HY78_07335 [Rhizorhabdus wittichii DC-6]|nr:hypothetical protein HY78_07335 [Rhizorhabdus wittichii DC-6]